MELEDYLEHFGVKGMRWGVRNDPGQGVRQAQSRSDAIRDARARSNINARRVNTAADRHAMAKSPQALSKSKKEWDEASINYLKSPDRATALLMTKGEKVALAAIAIGIPGPGTAGAAGYAAMRVALRKAVEADVRARQGGRTTKKPIKNVQEF